MLVNYDIPTCLNNNGGAFKIVFDTYLAIQELIPEVGRTGQTRMDWLHERDLLKLKSLALLELEIIFADHDISHSWRNPKKKKPKEGNFFLLK